MWSSYCVAHTSQVYRAERRVMSRAVDGGAWDGAFPSVLIAVVFAGCNVCRHFESPNCSRLEVFRSRPSFLLFLLPVMTVYIFCSSKFEVRVL